MQAVTKKSNKSKASQNGSNNQDPSSDNYLEVHGAREHNLKNIDIKIPKNKLVTITGVSGSGKSSLAFDTIFAEGQRRYVESLSAYARQFLGQLDKPDVEEIKGLSPAIAIDQKSTSHNPRSTVGTITEIYDHLRLLFARIGIPHCPECGTEIQAQTIDQIVDQVMALDDGSKVMIMAPLLRAKKGEHQNLFSALKSEGFLRVRVDGVIYTLEEEIKLYKTKPHDVDLVVDRVVIKGASKSRIADSISLALNKGEGKVIVHELISVEKPTEGNQAAEKMNTNLKVKALDSKILKGSKTRVKSVRDQQNTTRGRDHLFSELLACPNGHGSVPDLNPRNFSFNTPHGACQSCSGIGFEQEFSEDLVVPARSKSLKEGAIAPWSKTNNIYYKALLDALAKAFEFSIETPFEDLPDRIQEIILNGTTEKRIKINTSKYPSLKYSSYSSYYEGVLPQLSRRFREAGSEKWKAEVEQYMLVKPCPSCGGSRLSPEPLAVTVASKNIYEVCQLSIDKVADFFDKLEKFLKPRDKKIVHQLLIEIRSRLKFLVNVGLTYLTLSRSAKTLSGGEAQRIRLASQIGSGLSGVLYVLDEPSIGLHQRDNDRLLDTLVNLRDLGNTVLVVEHDEDTMMRSDWIVDIGRGAGVHGGHVVAEGVLDDIKNAQRSITGEYLSGRKEIAVPKYRREGNGKFLKIYNARKNNLKNLNLEIPLGKFIAVTGVSGSGKSSLVNDLLFPYLRHHLGGQMAIPEEIDNLEGYEELDKVIVIDQSPIGRTPRSNPATYTGVFDGVRDLFSQTKEAKARGYTAGRFSFNVKGGRCEACGGAGVNEIEMNFLPSVFVKCDVCKGKRYNQETLQVTFKGKSIYDVLEMTIEEGLHFFDAIPKARNKLQTLHDVGLDYIKLGQAATTLSGGEAQRVKLASELSKRSTGKTIYLLDEPTTGLHWKDIQHLLNVLNRLVDAGNTVLVIEHNLDVIKQADHIIDLGPEGGDAGGQVIASGTPESVAKIKQSHTGRYLKPKL